MTRYDDNVEGSWYVNDRCINCNLCDAIAPNTFKMSDSGDHSVVYEQPVEPSDIEAAEEAKVSCPVEAIHDDG